MSSSREAPQAESSKSVLVRSLKLAEESKQIGVNTLVKLDEQTEQMRRIKADAEDTEHIIRGNRGVVKDMRRSWVVRLCCYNRADILPDDPNWSHRDTSEEQLRVKKMIKLDKRRRRVRRLQRKKDGESGASGGGGDNSAPSSKTSSWKFWNKRVDSDDSSDLSDLSEEDDLELEEESQSSPSKAGPKFAPKVTEKLIPDVGPIEIADEESGLDQLRNTIQDLKVIALQISETSQQQTAALGGITEQVNVNQSQLDKNNQLIGKLGRRAKNDGDDGMLSAQDRLAIMGVQSAIKSRMN
jgi:hypothetical protein